MHRRKFLVNSGIVGADCLEPAAAFLRLVLWHRDRFRTKSKSHTGGNTRGIYRPTVALPIRRTRTLH
jgi:hypothetical protein